MKDYRGECVLQPRSRFVAPSLFALLTRRVRRDLRDRVQHGDETDETHRHTQHNHRRDLQSRRLVRIKSQQTSLRRSSRVPLRVGRDDTSTHRTYARERTEAAQIVSHTSPRFPTHRARLDRVLVSIACAVPARALDRDVDARDAIRRARVVIHPLSRAIDRETRRERVRARVDAHAPDMVALESSSCGQMRRGSRSAPHFHPRDGGRTWRVEASSRVFWRASSRRSRSSGWGRLRLRFRRVNRSAYTRCAREATR